MHRYSMLVAVLSARYRNKLKPGKVKKKTRKKHQQWDGMIAASPQPQYNKKAKWKQKNQQIDRDRTRKTRFEDTRKKIKVQTRDRQQTNEWTDRQTRKYHNQYIVMISTKMTKQYKIKESIQINKVRTKRTIYYILRHIYIYYTFLEARERKNILLVISWDSTKHSLLDPIALIGLSTVWT